MATDAHREPIEIDIAELDRLPGATKRMPARLGRCSWTCSITCVVTAL